MTVAAGQSFFRPKPALIAAVAIAVIIYGSLYPFVFRAHAHSGLGEALAALLATWTRPTSRGDIISNVLLYVPLGFFAAHALAGLPRAARVGLATALGLCICIAVEIAQFYEAARNSTMSDVYSNTAGTFLGAVAAVAFHRGVKLPFIGQMSWQPFPVLLLAAWGGYRLYPYVPAIDLQKYKDALKPLIFSPTLTATGLYRHAATWLVLAVLLEALFGAGRRRLLFVLLVPAVLFARILIVGTVLSPNEVAGAALALLLWLAVLSHLRVRTGIVALLFVGAVVIQSLAPFQFQPWARPFGWIPFLSFMRGSMEVNVLSMFEKVFTYGSLLWLLTRSGLSLGVATTVTALMIFALRYAQVYLPGRSAEITDFAMVLVLGLVMKLLADEPLPGRAHARPARA
jgi:VanZ family protein